MYIWHLWKHTGTDENNSMIGQYIFPTEDIGNCLNAEWIILNLNYENCFDFKYTPSEGDNLYITQNIELSSYISFIFKNGEWTIGHYSPFSDILQLISSGKIVEP